ncbi:MAG: hypothetical protein DRI90_04705 [Deltaproteobacteria bacterium]|nr:MAG: hypothetical protein DRI90_04705 [Deltaproteobacteria bacterium]
MDTPARDVFDRIYRGAEPDQIAWHYDEPPEQLITLIESGQLAPCKAIELGCGLGSQCVALAQRGFEVTGVDCQGARVQDPRDPRQVCTSPGHLVARGEGLALSFRLAV